MLVPENPPIVFIAGPARSGTTMLTLILSAHSKVCLAPENRFIPSMLRRFSEDQALRGRSLEVFKQAVKNDQKLHALKIDIEPYLERVKAYHAISLREALLSYFSFYRDATHPAATVVGQKKNYLDIWPQMKRVFPEAKLITIFRDCRASALSAQRNLPNQNIVHAAKVWKRRAEQSKSYASAFPADYLELKYEEFVQTPEKYCHAICELLKLPYESSMLDYYQQNQAHQRILAGHEGKHVNTSGPINASRIKAWGSELRKSELAAIERIAGGQMKAKGYEMISGVDQSVWLRLWAAGWIWKYEISHFIHKNKGVV